MKTIGVIPARFASTRFMGKPLAMIAGKPMIQWCIEGVRQSKKLDHFVVATDDNRIFDVVKRLGVDCRMTSSDLPSGTDRIWSAIHQESWDLVINIQGDEPLVRGELVDDLISPFLSPDAKFDMATLGRRVSHEELNSPTVVKVVLDKESNGLYFSRFGIPYSRGKASEMVTGCLAHVGMYAYTKEALKKICNHPICELEMGESLEQLRALYLGLKIKVIQTHFESVGVDIPSDIERVERILLNGKQT